MNTHTSIDSIANFEEAAHELAETIIHALHSTNDPRLTTPLLTLSEALEDARHKINSTMLELFDAS
ncbi:hypothetical protein [Candidatus Symbiobacter mobilis]|uniref:Uncharacterized protein n=1 Tax=Candidatus Symbiobacter mobilis CR TaxID=946483 RepID=U5ND09_9BURK|nr:hypothetical protein [Candidatus Symbiobacter mobilis]AGX88054.1 hypothetical protein Cenrod_1981 [Candidatus Symbiobacter mobilis CR]